MTEISSPSSALDILDLGLVDYSAAWECQKALVKGRIDGDTLDTLIMCEHPPVITHGRGTPKDVPGLPEVPVFSVERGGELTYHAPGQLVVYPILKLAVGERNLHGYLRRLETVVIETLRSFGLLGMPNPGLTGVWVETTPGESLQKIASIGVAVRHWVTYHGIALNVDLDLTPYQHLNPCGLDGSVMTSLVQQLDRPVTVADVKPLLIEAFKQEFGK